MSLQQIENIYKPRDTLSRDDFSHRSEVGFRLILKFICYALSICLIGFSSACSTPPIEYYHGVGIKNQSSSPISSVVVEYGARTLRFKARFAGSGVGQTKTYGEMLIPKELTISWLDESNSPRSTTIPIRLAKGTPVSAISTIEIHIYDDRVELFQSVRVGSAHRDYSRIYPW